jgi:hypothetical protein
MMVRCAVLMAFAAACGCGGTTPAPIATVQIPPPPPESAPVATTESLPSPRAGAQHVDVPPPPDQTRVTECNALIQVLNSGLASLELGPKPGSANGVGDLKEMADAMDKVARDAGKVELTIAQLKRFSGDYQAMASDVSKAARAMAAAAEVKDMQKLTTSRTALEAAVKKEDPLVDSVNKFCQAP